MYSIKTFFFALCILFFLSNPIHAQKDNNSLTKFIEKKRDHNLNNKKGFSLVLYNGNEEKAIETFKSFKEEYKDVTVKLSYVSPDWKVLTVPYHSKIEAEKVYLRIREKFPNAKIL